MCDLSNIATGVALAMMFSALPLNQLEQLGTEQLGTDHVLFS